MGLWLRYSACTFLYGAIHTIMDMPSEKTYTNHTNGKRETQPVLFTQKVGYLMLGGSIGPGIWPILFRDDLIALECLLRGKDPARYGRMFNMFD
jgi:hypothetical protein